MDNATLFAIVSGVAGALVGAVAGRLNALQGYAAINQILQSRITDLEHQETEKTAVISSLTIRIETLEGLVTQRAEVAALHAKVDALTTRIDAIATHMGV